MSTPRICLWTGRTAEIRRRNVGNALKIYRARKWRLEYWWVDTRAISRRIYVRSKITLRPKPKLLRKISLTEIQIRWWLSRKLKNLSRSGLTWLKAWITFALRNTLEFLAPWRSLSLIGWRNRFSSGRFSISQLALKAVSSVACAFVERR